MAREIQAAQSRGTVHLPKNVTRYGSNQRDWMVSRLRMIRRITIALSFGAGAVFTGLALRHSALPSSPPSAQTVQTSTQAQTVQSQVPNAPSQSLFDSQNSSNFSVAPAPRASVSRVRTVSS